MKFRGLLFSATQCNVVRTTTEIQCRTYGAMNARRIFSQGRARAATRGRVSGKVWGGVGRGCVPPQKIFRLTAFRIVHILVRSKWLY